MDNKLYNNFIDVAIDEKYIGYRTGNTVFEEGLKDGKLLSLSYNASGFLMATNPLANPSLTRLFRHDSLNGSERLIMACPESFQLAVDGQSLNSHWEKLGIDVTDEDGCKISKIRLKSQLRPIEAAVCVKLDGTSVFERWIEVTNTGDKPAALNEIAPLSGTLQMVNDFEGYLQDGKALYELGYFRTCNWGHEGNLVWMDLPEEIHTISGRYRRDRHRHPMFLLKNKATGEMFICQFAWSGGYAFEFDNLQYADSYSGNTSTTHNVLSVKVRMDSPQPMYVIEPGKTFVSPVVHMGVVFGGLDEAVNAMHEHVRKSVLIRPEPEDMLLIESPAGPEYDMSREPTMRLVDIAAEMGAEVFFIDASWYAPPNCEGNWWEKAGDWNYDKDRYPYGIAEMRDYIHSKGMRLGMWIDLERIGKDSKVFKEHPDWLGTLYNGKPNGAGLLDLANPKVAKWMEEQAIHLIEDYKVEMFRLDWNVDAPEALNAYEHCGYLENTYYVYSKVVYDMYRRLRKKYPHVIFENCAGGGGRTDLGMVANFHHTWVTDWQKAPRSFGITNGMTIALPPECVDRLVGAQNSYFTGDLRFKMHNMMFTHMTPSPFYPIDQAKHDGMMEFIQHCIQLYKDFARPIIPRSKIYHHTPVLDSDQPQGFGIIELSCEEDGKGMLGVFQLSDPKEKETIVKLRGVEIDKKYKVYFDNSRKSVEIDGFTLANCGLHVRLEGALTSELVTYEAL